MAEEPEGLRMARRMAEAADILYPDLKRNATERVARWEWATLPRYSLQPCYFELGKFMPGEPLAGPPDPPNEATGHAFDCDCRLILELDQTEFPGCCYETYYVYESDGIARYYFDYDASHRWLAVSWMSLDSRGRIDHIDSVYARGNFLSESFEYGDCGRVVRVRRQGLNEPLGYLDDLREIEYNDRGEITRTLWVYPDGTRKMDFERPHPDRTLSSCREKLSGELTEAIKAALADAAAEAPVYALAIYYCDDMYQYRLPPEVAICTESDLQRFRDEYPEDWQCYSWYPAEWKTHLSLPLDRDLMDLCESVNQDIWQNKLEDEVIALFWEIASSLSASELPIQRSAGFVAYVTNLEDDPIPDVRYAATAEALEILVNKGLL